MFLVVADFVNSIDEDGTFIKVSVSDDKVILVGVVVPKSSIPSQVLGTAKFFGQAKLVKLKSTGAVRVRCRNYPAWFLSFSSKNGRDTSL